ncbi:MAG: type II toxin-antitoxin system VapC family toxin [Chloroflexota bacterium]
MLTVDANVWVSILDTADAFHAPSVELFREAGRRNIAITIPAFTLVEVACVVARRFRDSAAGAQAASAIAARRPLHIVPLDHALLSLAVRLGAYRFLRGADALYAAAAQLTGTTLVTWDNELIQRAGAQTPTDWRTTLTAHDA